MFFKHVDWMLLKAYFKAYAIFMVSMLTLYVVIDLFTNLDDFVPKEKRGLLPVLQRIGTYYAYQLPQLFDRLCEAISLLAAMFTIVMMQRNSEHLPLLSAGVPTRRIVAPVLASACFMLLLAVVNQELVIPRIIDKLLLEKSDPEGLREVPVRGAYEPNLIHLKGETGNRATRTVTKMHIVLPEGVAGTLIHIVAAKAEYKPGEEHGHGRWILSGCTPRDLPTLPGVLETPDPGQAVLTTRSVDFDSLTRSPRWFSLTSTARICQELQRPESNRAAALAVLFHMRLARPLVGMVLVFLGLSLILRDQTRNIVISSGQCILLCGLFFAACQGCKMLGDAKYLSPTLAAWLPILLFGPLAIVQFDAIQT